MYRNYVNEAYYATANTPSFPQFKDKYEFYDDQGRLYKIAVKNRQVFENTRFKNTRIRSTSTRTDAREPFINNYGWSKLFVKLGNTNIPWFGHRDMNRRLQLHARDGSETFIVELKREEKIQAKRRVGIIYVKGLDKRTLHELLNP